MLKRIFDFFKGIIISAFALYAYNLITAPLNIIIPINFLTITCVTVLGLPAIIGLTIIQVLVF